MSGSPRARSIPLRVSDAVSACLESLRSAPAGADRRIKSQDQLIPQLDAWEESIREAAFPPIDPAVFAEAFDIFLDEDKPESLRRIARRKGGAYFTPPLLIDPIIEHALQPLLTDQVRCRFTSSQEPFPPRDAWSGQEVEQAEETVLSIRVCDPACGPAPFLVKAAEFLASRLVWVRNGDKPCSTNDWQKACIDVASRCLVGVDLDPTISRAAQIALWLWCGAPETPSREIAKGIHAGDSLGTTGPANAFDWNRMLSLEVEPSRGGFDAVIGNPPFANAIEQHLDESVRHVKADRGESFSELSGTADLAYYFLALADRLAAPDGAVGMVLPRAVLNTASAQTLRQRLTETRPPTLIFAPEDPFLFRDANIYVVALVLRSSPDCLGGRATTSDGALPILDRITISSDNWWSPLLGTSAIPSSRGNERLGDRFEVFGSMTAGMAYDLVPFIREEAELPIQKPSDTPRLRLITTGLIDPGRSLWEEKPCRYLKQKFTKPVIDERQPLPTTIADRLQRVRHPKILVAGLSNRIEAVLDVDGTMAGAVSTYTILHDRDDVAYLRWLVEFLNSEDATTMLHQELGATALGGGRITLTKGFLQRLPLPTSAVQTGA